MIKGFFCFILFAAFLCLSNSPYAQEQTGGATLKEGDFWCFNIDSKAATGADTSAGIIPTGTYLVRFAKKRLQAYRVIGHEEQALEQSLGLFSLIGRQPGAALQNTRLTASSRDLDFPLSVGKTWQYTYELDIPKGTRHRSVSVRVLAMENVETAAGSFHAFKIEKYIQWPTASALRGTTVENVRALYFYSPQAKSTVKFHSEGTDGATRDVELVKFGTAEESIR